LNTKNCSNQIELNTKYKNYSFYIKNKGDKNTLLNIASVLYKTVCKQNTFIIDFDKLSKNIKLGK